LPVREIELLNDRQSRTGRHSWDERSGRLHRVKVGADGNGVVSPAGSALLRELAAESPGSVVGAFGEPKDRQFSAGTGTAVACLRF
jgi:hypothetical protein